jgi:hypothetical protein
VTAPDPLAHVPEPSDRFQRMSTQRLAPILSDDVIDAALRRAEREVCAPGDPRCYGFAYSVEDALRSMQADGWCRVGWVAGRSGRDDWDVWFHVVRGEVRCEDQRTAAG